MIITESQCRIFADFWSTIIRHSGNKIHNNTNDDVNASDSPHIERTYEKHLFL